MKFSKYYAPESDCKWHPTMASKHWLKNCHKFTEVRRPELQDVLLIFRQNLRSTSPWQYSELFPTSESFKYAEGIINFMLLIWTWNVVLNRQIKWHSIYQKQKLTNNKIIKEFVILKSGFCGGLANSAFRKQKFSWKHFHHKITPINPNLEEHVV